MAVSASTGVSTVRGPRLSVVVVTLKDTAQLISFYSLRYRDPEAVKVEYRYILIKNGCQCSLKALAEMKVKDYHGPLPMRSSIAIDGTDCTEPV